MIKSGKPGLLHGLFRRLRDLQCVLTTLVLARSANDAGASTAAQSGRTKGTAQLADAQSGRKEAAKKEKGVFREALVHPPDARPRTPAKGYALCTPKNCRGERGHPRQGACKAPWSPVLKRHKVVRSSI
jgi:hypothetical protein